MNQAEMLFAVSGEGSSTLEIDVYDRIGETWDGRGMSAKKMRGILRKNQEATQIRLRVNSGGGDVIDGFAIYQLLAEHPARVVANVDALAASMASVIIMAADEIHASKHSLVMIHNPWTVGIGDASEMRKTADLLDKVRDNIADAYVTRTDANRADVLGWMDAETWMTAEEAHQRGFVDAVKDAKQPSAQALAGLNLSAFGRVPEGFAQMVASARKPEQPTNDSTAIDGGYSNTEKEMDLKELKAQHPETFAEAVQQGVKDERERVMALFAAGKKAGDVGMQIASEAIEAGGVYDVATAERIFEARLAHEKGEARQRASDEAGRAVDNAAAPKTSDDINEEQVKAMAEKTRALLGRKVN